MYYVILRERFLGVQASWRNVCQIKKNLTEFYEEEFGKYTFGAEEFQKRCNVFVCSDTQAGEFQNFWKEYVETENKIEKIVGIMAWKDDEDLTEEERTEVARLEAQIENIYQKAWQHAQDLNLEMVEDVMAEVEGAKTTMPKNDKTEKTLFVVTCQNYSYTARNYGMEVFVCGVFDDYEKAQEVAAKYEDSDINELELNASGTYFSAGAYWE